jgi:hypothetical protein
MRDDEKHVRRELYASLFIITLLVAFALSGLAHDENWRKFVRVSLGFSAYIITLVAALRVRGLKGKTRLPFWLFALAGALAEACSGWLRPSARVAVDVPTVIVAAILIGGTHWLALRSWRPFNERIRRASLSSKEVDAEKL